MKTYCLSLTQARRAEGGQSGHPRGPGPRVGGVQARPPRRGHYRRGRHQPLQGQSHRRVPLLLSILFSGKLPWQRAGGVDWAGGCISRGQGSPHWRRTGVRLAASAASVQARAAPAAPLHQVGGARAGDAHQVSSPLHTHTSLMLRIIPQGQDVSWRRNQQDKSNWKSYFLRRTGTPSK